MASVPVDPLSVAAELGATKAATSIAGRITDAWRRRECRQQLAQNVWSQLVARSDGRLSEGQGRFDPDALWEWMNRPEVAEALRSADPMAIRQHGESIRLAWQSSTYDSTNVLSGDDGRLAAELLFYLLVVDVLAGDELLSVYAARILNSIESLHNDLALVCVTLSESTPSHTDNARRRLAISTDGVLSVADRGLRQSGGETVQIDRAAAEQELATTISGQRPGTVLLVTGQPDVGKSHLTMRVLRRLRVDRDVFAFDLRQQATSLFDLETALGTTVRAAVEAPGDENPPIVAIDGAEVIQTIGPELLRALVTQAAEGGCCVVLTSRDDASAEITQLVAGAGLGTARFEVSPLSKIELAATLEALPTAQTLTSMPAGRWIARRPGLLQAWLMLRPQEVIQNEGHLVDLLRRHYLLASGPGRHARIHATKSLARVELGDAASSLDSTALDQLRSSGVLAQPTNTWDTRITFSDDLWRDAAIAGVVADNPGILAELSAVRSALRAAVLACQLRLNSDLGSVTALVQAFERVASRTGQARWGEVPFEALASLGGPAAQWRELLHHLTKAEALESFMSTARRTTASMMSDAPLAMTGLIEAILDDCGDHPEARRTLRAWLEAAAVHAPDVSSPARQRLCAYLVETPPDQPWRDDELVEWLNDLAMCGPDLTAEAASILRRNAAERPDRLDEVFRSFPTGIALAVGQPDLLLELCESYYIVRKGWAIEALRAPHRWFGGPRFNALDTPIAHLLQVRPVEAVALVSTLLDAACQRGSRRGEWRAEPNADTGVVEIDVPGRGVVHLSGGPETWSWYRGGIASPVSAVNILLAIERFADQMIAAGITVDEVTRVLLRQTHSLPLVGLCVGLAIRHLDLDAPNDSFVHWSRQYTVWSFEVSRLTAEMTGFGFVETNKVTKEEMRKVPITSLAPHVAASAVLRGDEALIDQFEKASLALGASNTDDAVVRVWAWTIRPSAMRIVETDGTQRIVLDVPDDLGDALGALHGDDDGAIAADAIAMRNMYGSSRVAVDRLAEDITICRSLVAGGAEWHAARTNTAAAAIRAMFVYGDELAGDDVAWAVDELLDWPPKSNGEDDDGQDPDDVSDGDGEGGEIDRYSVWRPTAAIASALPPLRAATIRGSDLLDPEVHLPRIEAALRELARLGSAEIVWILLAETSDAWRQPCTDQGTEACSNALVAELCEVVLDRSVEASPMGVGGWNDGDDDDSARSHEHGLDDGHSQRDQLNGNDDLEPRDVLRCVRPELLLAPLALAATWLRPCSHVGLEAIVNEGLTVHAEPFRKLGQNPYTDGNHFARIGQALFALLQAGRVERVAAYMERLAPSFQAQALRGVRQVAGDDPTMRPVLGEIWPALLLRLNAVLGHDDRWSDPHAELLPTVQVDPYSMRQPDAWNEAIANWFDPRLVDAALPRWVETAAGCANCAAALGLFLSSADPAWSLATGLPLAWKLLQTVTVEALKERRAAWLADIPDDPRLSAALAGNDLLLAIIDRYVQADDPYALIARKRLDPAGPSR